MDTTYNFVRTLPAVAVLAIATLGTARVSITGAIFASLSGGLSSKIGYTIWYAALRSLSSTQAAVVQLLVPIIAALGGALFVSEDVTLRIAISTVVRLGGVLIVVFGRTKSSASFDA